MCLKICKVASNLGMPWLTKSYMREREQAKGPSHAYLNPNQIHIYTKCKMRLYFMMSIYIILRRVGF